MRIRKYVTLQIEQKRGQRPVHSFVHGTNNFIIPRSKPIENFIIDVSSAFVKPMNLFDAKLHTSPWKRIKR